MKNLLYLAFGVLLLIAITIVFVVVQNNTTPTEESSSTEISIPPTDQPDSSQTNDEQGISGQDSASNFAVRYTALGFEPRDMTVSAGDTVTFVNESGQAFWPASVVHPIHTVYPGSGISKCSTAPAGTIFDACTSIGVGQEWQFQFDEVGTWGYHNHLRASHTGKITVE